MGEQATALKRSSAELLSDAVHRNSKPLSVTGLQERAFALAFRNLVYPQIWEDPVVDMEALEINPDCRVVTIASGGCNALSYLVADPAQIIAVDLNSAHIALNKLKNAAARHLPDYASFHRFFADAAHAGNLDSFEAVKPHLDAATVDYWEGRDILGRRRITQFTRGFYRYGLLGRFIGTGHIAARILGVDVKTILAAKTLAEQRRIFDEKLAPLFDKALVRKICDNPASLFGLGIPPAQYKALLGNETSMAVVLRKRLEKLACDFPLAENYFAWQAFNRGYETSLNASLPPYLEARNFELIKARASRIDIRLTSYTTYLLSQPQASLDRYILLDAQDWMGDKDLTELWREITRTAKPGARVIFRTADEHTLLPGRVPDAILDRWDYRAEESKDFTRRDRSAIYGAMHLYVLKDA